MESSVSGGKDQLSRLSSEEAEALLKYLCHENLIIPLLLLLQSKHIEKLRNKEEEKVKDEEVLFAEEVIDFLVMQRRRRLSEGGWQVYRRGSSLGSYVFRRGRRTRERLDNSITGKEVEAEESESPQLPGDKWEQQVAQDMSMLRVHGWDENGGEVWAVKVQCHSEDAFCCVNKIYTYLYEVTHLHRVNTSLSEKGRFQSWSILDVLKMSDEEETIQSQNIYALKTVKNQRRNQSPLNHKIVVMRQLVMGAWQGSNAVAFSEKNTDLSPGFALETWHEMSAAGLAVYGANVIRRHRHMTERLNPIRFLVLGAGSLATILNFLMRYCDENLEFIMVEEDCRLAEAAIELMNHPASGVFQWNSSDPIAKTLCASKSKIICPPSYEEFLHCWNCEQKKDISHNIEVGIIFTPGSCTTRESVYQSTLKLSSSNGFLVLLGHATAGDIGIKKNESISFFSINQMDDNLNYNDCVTSSGPSVHISLNNSFPFCDNNLPISSSSWDAVMSSQLSSDDIDGFSLTSLPLSMDVKKAQTTSAILLKQFVSQEEAEQIHRLAGRTSRGGRAWTENASNANVGREIRSAKSMLWEVLFLQSYGIINKRMPEFIDKVVDKVICLDSEEKWGFELARGNFCLRVCEYHCQIAPSEALQDIHHYDQDSLVTVDIMLSDPLSEFEGGIIQTLEADGSLSSHSVMQFDALCFVSHKYHSVTPLKAGRRVVCVLEFWRGSVSPRICPHRCLCVGKPCDADSSYDNDGSSDRSCDGIKRPGFPFRLASVHQNSGISSDVGSMLSGESVKEGELFLLWQASDASEGVTNCKEVAVGGLDSSSIAQLNSMFDDDDDDSVRNEAE